VDWILLSGVNNSIAIKIPGPTGYIPLRQVGKLYILDPHYCGRLSYEVSYTSVNEKYFLYASTF
ncbi:hypothetical protein ACFLV5_05055, partial [Chloroflexota bacterium]